MAAIIRRQVCRRSPHTVFDAVTTSRYSSLASAESTQVSNTEASDSLYPPIKGKYPPGRWGGMKPSYAWLWHKHGEQSLEIPDVQQRIKARCEKEMNSLIFRVKEYRPRKLEFQKYVTKTHVISGMPDIYRRTLDSAVLDNLTSKLTPLVCDLIVLENDTKIRRGQLKQFKKAGDKQNNEMSHLVLRSILIALITQLSSQFPHLLTAQHDERVTISALWDRHGLERNRKKMIHPHKFICETVNDHRLISTTCADFVLRSDKPLPEFVSGDEAASLSTEIRELKYSPIVYGQHMNIKGKAKVEAGHTYGDPCEFGLLSMHNTVWSYHLAAKYGAHHAQDAVLGQGIGASFVWLVAQAHNQGFNSLIELTYPLTTQTVLSDGQTWRFLAYQLNTLELWKDEEANSISNLCWVSEETKLYDCVEAGKVQGFNSDVLRQLIAFLALSPADRKYDLKATLPPAISPRDEEYIPLKKEVAVITEEEKYVYGD